MLRAQSRSSAPPPDPARLKADSHGCTSTKPRKPWPQNFATFRLHACFHKFRIRQTQLQANSTKPSEAAIAETAAPLRNRRTPPRVPLCETCGDRHASRESCCGSSERLHRFTAGHPGPEPHRVSRPWRPAVGLRPRLIPGVTSVTRDPLAGYVTSNPRGNPSWWGDTRVTLGRLVCFDSPPLSE